MQEKFEKPEQEKFPDLQSYLDQNSKVLAPEDQIDEGLKRMLKPKQATLTYYGDKVKVDFDGVNAVYLDQVGNLLHSFIIPENIENIKLEKIGDVWEKLEQEFTKLGYEVTYDDLFHTAISKQLKTKDS